MTRLERSHALLAPVLFALVACTTHVEEGSPALAVSSATPVDASPKASSQDAALYSRFHVALIEADVEPGTPGFYARPWSLRGRTVIGSGGAPLISTDDGIESDTAIDDAIKASTRARGHADGDPSDILGRWPDDAWMMTFNRDDQDHERHFYRWTQDHWHLAVRTSSFPRFVAQWKDDVLMDEVEHSTPDGIIDRHPHNPLSAFAPDGSEVPAPASDLLALHPSDPDKTTPTLDYAASIDGSLFIVAEPGRPGRLMVERIQSGATKHDLYELAPRLAQARLWTKSARDVVAFGGARNADEKPVLSHFDGDLWTPIEPPPGIDLIVGYDRSAAGTERVFAYRGEELSCWERLHGAAWQSLAFPALGPKETIDGHWITDDDAWLHIQAEGKRGRLLRLRPVKHIYVLSDAPTFVPAAPELDRLLAAKPDVSPPPLPDPSPFHEAVVSYPDRTDAELPNALTLCPAHGRAFVCGVSDAPLLSTDHGVVSDLALLAAIDMGKAQPRPWRVPDAPSVPAVRPKGAVPRGVDRVEAYDRTPSGVERIFTYAGEALSLYERQADAPRDSADAWHAVLLPRLAKGDRVQRVWLVNDDAWLLIWPRDTNAHAPRLMRMKPVDKVWSFPRGLPHDRSW